MFDFLRPRFQNPGLLWVDERDARKRVSAKARTGEITPREEADLVKFSRDGYFTIQLELSPGDAARLDRDVQRLWNERPANVSFAYDSPPRRFTEAVEAEHRRPRYRIHDFHSASGVALSLYLHPTIHRYASLILGESAVATQSLYFEYGSQQALHRDSTVVPTPEFGRLVAAWIALEDISAESGPLAYVPGSQRFPFYAFRPGEFVYDPTRHSPSDVEAAVNFYRNELEKSRLPERQFLARRGEVLIWHSALMHGGAQPRNENQTRKSLAVHYSSRRTQRTREAAVTEQFEGATRESVYSTSEVLQRGEAFGFANPLNGEFLYHR